MMKKLILPVFFALVGLLACKKDKPVLIDPFEKVSLADIQSKEGQMTIDDILLATPNANTLKPGAIIVYKTNGGSFGKLVLRQSGYTDAVNHRFIFDMVNYDASGNEQLRKTNVTIYLGFMVDLDEGVETGIDGTQSFVYFQGGAGYILRPDGGLSKFFVYSN